MVRQVQPLRISKTTPSSSPAKMSAANRPLSEISAGSMRRNSPSYNQATKASAPSTKKHSTPTPCSTLTSSKKMIVTSEASPYTENSFSKTSNRDLWSTRDTMMPTHFDAENSFTDSLRSPSPDRDPSPKRRPSVEKLQQASRVKNSKIFELETKVAYDPSNAPMVERPSANRPFSQNFANNSFARFDSLRKENNPLRTSPQRPGHKRSETEISLPTLSPTRLASSTELPLSPEKAGSPAAGSPTKSSLSRSTQFGLHNSPGESSPAWSDNDDRCPTPRAALHRHNKSVTFETDPPVINEYDNPTPEPSVGATSNGSREGSWESEDFEDADISFDRGSSADRDDSFDADLENADKTPVVLPEHWSRMSPEEARRDLVDDEDDVFESSVIQNTAHHPRSDSVTSDGDARPLPPLPSVQTHGLRKMESRHSLKVSEHTVHVEEEELVIRNLDTGETKEVHVRVAETEVQEDSVVAEMEDFAKAPPRISRESILRKVRGGKYDFDDEEEGDDEDDEHHADNSRPSYAELARWDPDEPVPSKENSRAVSEDQVHVLRSNILDDAENEDAIKQEDQEDEFFDMSAVPAAEEDVIQQPASPSHLDDYERQSSVLRHGLSLDSGDTASKYSPTESEIEQSHVEIQQETTDAAESGKEALHDAMALLTVKDYSEPQKGPSDSLHTKASFVGLPTYLGSGDWALGMQAYCTPSPPAAEQGVHKSPSMPPSLENKQVREASVESPDMPPTPVDAPGTPESVIRRSSDQVSDLGLEEAVIPDEEEVVQDGAYDGTHRPVSPVIPERSATIRTGGKLKARPSGTPADFESMNPFHHRVASAEHPVPAIPTAYAAEFESAAGAEVEREEDRDSSLSTHGHSSQAKLDLTLDIPNLGPANANDGGDLLGLEREFERVIEGQKVSGGLLPLPAFARFAPSHGHTSEEEGSQRPQPPLLVHYQGPDTDRKQKGYLMRQNTKVVVASTRNFSGDSDETVRSHQAATAANRSASRSKTSPRKPSAEQYLKTEPWNGQVRRKSVRNASVQRANDGPAPPLPGHESALGTVSEDQSLLNDNPAEGAERGRLFIKVAGVKDLDLPLPRNDRVDFKLTLDNGLHCVTTGALELGRNAPIGQEFELVVLNDLDFQLTLSTRLPPPPKTMEDLAPKSAPSSPIKQSKSALSRFLSSPKKRAEKERQEREAQEAEDRKRREDVARKRASVQPNPWDRLRDLVNGADGSFARAYVNLAAHESTCFGRKLTVDVPLYNEWALEKDVSVVSSVRSKRGAHSGPVRRPPYIIGNLECQLLYIPKPKDAAEEDMPKSMSSAVREMAKASEVVEVSHEGFLSQQGGDCVVSLLISY